MLSIDDRLVFRVAERMWEKHREVLEPDPAFRSKIRFAQIGRFEQVAFEGKARAVLAALVDLGAAVMLPDSCGVPAFAAADLPSPTAVDDEGFALWMSPLFQVTVDHAKATMVVTGPESSPSGDGVVMASVLAVLAGAVSLTTLDVEGDRG